MNNLRCIWGKEVTGPPYLNVDTKQLSTRWWEVKWVPEQEYPYPLVTGRYLLDHEVKGKGSHVVLIKDEVVKVGSWQECSAWAEQKTEGK